MSVTAPYKIQRQLDAVDRVDHYRSAAALVLYWDYAEILVLKECVAGHMYGGQVRFHTRR